MLARRMAHETRRWHGDCDGIDWDGALAEMRRGRRDRSSIRVGLFSKVVESCFKRSMTLEQRLILIR